MNWKKFISKGRLIEFPSLHFALSEIKNNVGHIVVKSKPDNKDRPTEKLVSIGSGPTDYNIEITAERTDTLNNLTSAFCRSGLIKPYGIDEVAKELAKNRDLILGLDTNMLYNSVVSEHLLGAISDQNPYSYTRMPNWVLLVVPGVVMKEIENAANHKNKGRLTHIGRVGFRALVEINQLQESKGNSGVATLVIGKTNPQQLRFSEDDSGKLENADSLIRDQFRSFLKDIDLGKGIYFLTMDKTNASLGKAEGLNSIRVQHPKMIKNGYEFHQLPGDTILLGRIIYELAVEFGIIELSWKEHGRYHYLELDSAWQWKNMEHWENWQLLCNGYDHNFFKELNEYGEIPIEKIRDNWKKIREKMG
ncbi:MAG: PIN domain-containing protein [Thermoplasmatota archaeon]